MESDAENQLDRMESQQMDSREYWYTRRKRHLKANIIKHRKLSKYCHCHGKEEAIRLVLATIEVK